MEWLLVIYLGAATTPTVIVDAYQSEDQCWMAAELIKAADIAVRKEKGSYSTVCQEQVKD